MPTWAVAILATLLLSATLAHHASSSGPDGSGTTGPSPSGLAQSSADAHTVQSQPPAGSCQALGAGVYARPDRRCTPGAVNPAVTQANIDATVCRRGWTATVRPPQSVTAAEKRASLAAYGIPARRSAAYEYDHDVPLELGGAVNDPRNLWPEPDYANPGHGFYLNPKDRLETALRRLVCARAIGLARAQRLIATDWTSALRHYG